MRKVLITGSTAGFGKLLVESFLRNGDFVIATGRNLSQRRELFVTERMSQGNRLLEVDLDVTKKDDIARAVRTVEEKIGPIDILINNAGYGLFGALEDFTEEQVRYQMEVNFFGPLAVIQAFLPSLRTTKGKIINFSSVFGFMGFPLTSLYCASKYAIEGLTESLRGELAPHGVQVCLIEPGGYDTNFTQSLGWSTSEESSLYKNQILNYKKLHKRMAKKKQDPAEVARGILKLSKKGRLPMRKVFGKDALLSYGLKNFLPTWLYFFVMDRVFKFTFSANRT